MSSEEQWRDTGSSSGSLQRVASNAAYTRTQRAYTAYLDHRSTCASCPGPCTAADELWRAYREAEAEADT